MLLRHATPRKNLDSIGTDGLLCRKSQGRLPVVWLHAPSKSAWAMLHTVKRHGGRIEAVAVIELDVPRRWLRKSRRGLWYCRKDIDPARFRKLVNFAELAGPSVDEGRPTLQRPLALVA
jgi:hypothetical protein